MTTRRLYVVNHDHPPTEDDLTAAAGAGATEVICGLPPRLLALGVSTFGYHEVADSAPAAPGGPTNEQLRSAMIATGLDEASVDAFMSAAAEL